MMALISIPLSLELHTEASRDATKISPEVGSASFDTAHISNEYAKIPLQFERNEGQADSRVRYLSRGGAYDLFLTPHEAVLTLRKKQDSFGSRVNDGANPQSSATYSVLRTKFVGATSQPEIVGEDELPGKVNYFIGKPAKWRSNVSTYKKVRYRGIYPGIDLALLRQSASDRVRLCDSAWSESESDRAVNRRGRQCADRYGNQRFSVARCRQRTSPAQTRRLSGD